METARGLGGVKFGVGGSQSEAAARTRNEKAYPLEAPVRGHEVRRARLEGPRQFAGLMELQRDADGVRFQVQDRVAPACAPVARRGPSVRTLSGSRPLRLVGALARAPRRRRREPLETDSRRAHSRRSREERRETDLRVKSARAEHPRARRARLRVSGRTGSRRRAGSRGRSRRAASRIRPRTAARGATASCPPPAC